MPLIESPPGAYTVIDGQRYLYFVGTGYLGLQGHPEVIRAACEAAEKYGIGSATSRSGYGDTPPVLEVERAAAELFRLEDAFYFMSGYVGNHILVLALQETFDAVFVDELSHYCVSEAAQLTGRPVFRFRHGDAEDLAASLKANLKAGQRPLVASDGVFAARGTIAPVADYRDVLGEYPEAVLSIDDAHGLGVLGDNGRGTYEHAGLFDCGVNAEVMVAPPCPALPCGPRRLVCGTLSKAFGGFGGIIPGSRGFIERLKATSHYYSGASAPPVPVAAATAKAIELVQADPDMRTQLWENVARLKSGLRKMGLEVDDTPVPIVCLTFGSAENMQRIQRELMHREICIAYKATYAGLGPEGAIRLAVFSTHTHEMIEQLLEELQRLV
jgi:8-amino-7-oxononanoate synthase